MEESSEKPRNRHELAERLRRRLAEAGKVKVLFVCLGNICRSPSAEAVMLKTVDDMGCGNLWEIDSAGTGDYHIGDLADPRMRSAAMRRGIRLLHRARQVGAGDFYDFDMIIGMDESNLRNLRALSPTPETDARIFAMADFFPGGKYAPAVNGSQPSGNCGGAKHPEDGLVHTGKCCSAKPSATAGYDYVPDPYYSGAEGFELVLDMLQEACANLATLLP